MTRYTIPAACLAALGGLRDDDPGVLTFWAGDWPQDPTTYDLCWSHPMTGGLSDPEARRVILPQSAPALLRVLMRHRDAEPFASVPGVFVEDGIQRAVPRAHMVLGYRPSRLVIGHYPQPFEWVQGEHFQARAFLPALAEVLVYEAIAAHGSDPGWTVEVLP